MDQEHKQYNVYIIIPMSNETPCK